MKTKQQRFLYCQFSKLMSSRVLTHCNIKIVDRQTPNEWHNEYKSLKHSLITPQVNARSEVGAKRSSERVAGWRSEQKPKGRESTKERLLVATLSVKRQKQPKKKCNRRAQNQ